MTRDRSVICRRRVPDERMHGLLPDAGGGVRPNHLPEERLRRLVLLEPSELDGNRRTNLDGGVLMEVLAQLKDRLRVSVRDGWIE